MSANTPPPIQIDPQMRDKFVGTGFFDNLPDRNVNWGIGKDGLYLVKRSRIGTVTVNVAKLGGQLNILAAPPVAPTFEGSLPKIPFTVFSPAIAFLKRVKEEKKTEGLVRFFFHEGKWTAHVPNQTVGAAEVEVEEGLAQPPGHFAAEIHSHPGSSASPSNVDDANEQVDRMYMIVAFPSNQVPVFTARVGTGFPVWFPTLIQSFVDIEEKVRFRDRAASWFMRGGDTFPYMAFPERWMDAVQERKPVIIAPLNMSKKEKKRLVGRQKDGTYRVLSWEERQIQRDLEDEQHDQLVEKWLRENGRLPLCDQGWD